MKILIFADVSLAHVVRSIAYAKTLGDNDVTIVCNKRFEQFIPENFDSIFVETIPFQDKWSVPFTLKDVNNYIDNELIIIKDIKPDLIITDYRWSALISAEIADIPVTAITHQYYNPLSPISAGSKLLADWSKIFNFARMSNDLPPIDGDMRHFIHSGDKVVYTDHVDIIYNEIPTPANVIRVNDLDPMADAKLPEWWDDLPERVVYISLGDTGVGSLVPMIIFSLEMLGLTAVVSTSGKVILDYPFAAEFLPAQATADRSVLMINNGAYSGHRALNAGIPIIGITDNMDQKAYMASVRNAGKGVEIPFQLVSIAAIVEAVKLLLNMKKP